MHYYEFNIGDYMRDTAHLDEMEDLAYRRMLDLYYLRELPLPKTIPEIAKLIRMRTHSESIANVLREYFTLTDDGYVNEKANETLAKIYDKSEKAKKSAEKRWDNQRLKNANAVQTQCDGNANGMLPNNLIPNNPIPINNKQKKADLDFSEWPQQPSAEVLSAWLAMRKKVKASNTQLAMNTIGNELKIAVAAGLTVDYCLSIAESSGWKGFKADWVSSARPLQNQRPMQVTSFQNQNYQDGDL